MSMIIQMCNLLYNVAMSLIVIAHNIRSAHNIGSLFRTAEGFGVNEIILSGYSPYPTLENDTRLPHIREKITAQIHKTALGAETFVPFSHSPNIIATIHQLKAKGYTIAGLEQDATSVMLSQYRAPQKLALLLGEEVEGITSELRAMCDTLLEIPMHGQKESFNVSVAAGIALYSLTELR